MFSTNIEPRDLVDEAFLRRIPYKIEIGDPNEEEFHYLFKLYCKSFGCEYRADEINYLIDNHYHARNRSLRRCHPRDLLMQVRNYCSYNQPAARVASRVSRPCVPYVLHDGFGQRVILRPGGDNELPEFGHLTFSEWPVNWLRNLRDDLHDGQGSFGMTTTATASTALECRSFPATVRRGNRRGGYGEVWKVRAPGGLLKALKLVYGHFDEDRADA